MTSSVLKFAKKTRINIFSQGFLLYQLPSDVCQWHEQKLILFAVVSQRLEQERKPKYILSLSELCVMHNLIDVLKEYLFDARCRLLRFTL